MFVRGRTYHTRININKVSYKVKHDSCFINNLEINSASLKNISRNYSAINLFDESQKRAYRKRFCCNNIRVFGESDADSRNL